MIQESTLRKIAETNPTTQKHPKRKRAANVSIGPNLENRWTYEIGCLKREIEEQKALIKNLKEEAKKESPNPYGISRRYSKQ